MKGQRSESILAEVNCLPADRVLLSNTTVRLIDLCLRVRKVRIVYFYPARACAKGLRNRFCPSVSLSVSLSVCQSVCPVKNFEIRTFTRLKDCYTRQ